MRTIVIGNEKGGAGKSTVAVHLSVALAHEGALVGVLDLDTRQRSLDHFFASRGEIEAAFRRLIQRVHPDRGGAPGLAAKLNAARAVLLKAGR